MVGVAHQFEGQVKSNNGNEILEIEKMQNPMRYVLRSLFEGVAWHVLVDTRGATGSGTAAYFVVDSMSISSFHSLQKRKD